MVTAVRTNAMGEKRATRGEYQVGGLVALAQPVAAPLSRAAIFLVATLKPGFDDRATVRSAIAAIGPAIELADMDREPDDLAAVLAGDIFQRHVILGPRDESRAGAKLDGLAVRVTRSGKDLPVPSDLEANTGEIVAVVQHVASVAAALGDGVCAGQFIICGSVTAPMFLETGETGIEWTLDPIGRASVDFAA